MDKPQHKYGHDIWMAIQKIESYVVGMSQQQYLLDHKTKDAVERNFEIIGEAINQLRKIAPAQVENIRDYRKIIGFRNQLIHGYDMISDPITWDIIQQKLPLLKEDIAQFML